MIHYVIQIIAFQLLFLIVYDLFLKKETFFNWNRTYLLLTPIISLLLPFIQIEGIRQAIPETYLVQLPAVMIGDGVTESSALSVSRLQFSWIFIWYSGVVISSIIFGIKISRLIGLIRSGKKEFYGDLSLKILPGTDAAFTLFNTVYLGESLSDSQKKHILLHEQIHVKEKHSLDLFFFEIMRILLWFNPFVYIFQMRIGALHEFTADRKVAVGAGKEYYQNLLSQVFQTNKVSFINTFFNHSLIKNRIVMLQKSNSKKTLKFKYLLLVPIVCAMLIYTSCAQEAEPKPVEQENDFIMSTDSDILANIAALKESIAAKGEMTEEEAKALKTLYVITSEEGVNNLHFGEVKDNLEIPFGVIQKVPVYPGCEGLENNAAQKCFKEKVATFIVSNFDTEKFKGSSMQGRQRIAVNFVISSEGAIKNVVAKAEYKPLMEEAERVVKMLPNMQAGEHDGKKVNVQFALPIIFELE